MNPKEVGEQNNDQRESAEDYREDWRRVLIAKCCNNWHDTSSLHVQVPVRIFSTVDKNKHINFCWKVQEHHIIPYLHLHPEQ